MEGFLEEYRVLDLTEGKGHLCGRILGDMGADVIKIEPPGGDTARQTGPFYRDQPHPEKSLPWFFTNANKRGITLNLESADGQKIFRQLIARADLVVESFAPGYLAQLWLDYSALAKVKPDIILTSITPFGQTGPYADYKVTDIIAVAMGGMAYAFGDPDRAPVRISLPQAFFLGSQHAAIGSLLALYHRELTGEGQWIDTSIQEAIMFTLTYYFPHWEHRKAKFMRGGSSASRPRPEPLGTLTTRWTFPVKDGQICLAFQGGGRIAVKSSRSLVAWANAEGYALKLSDYNWEAWDSTKVVQSEQDFLDSEISPFLLTKTRAELLEMAAKRRLLLAPVNTVADLPHNPQLVSREFWVKVSHPELNKTLTYPGPFVKVDQCPQQVRRRAPLIGEHNQEIYEGELGLSRQELSLLKAREVI
jgi:crotonobetainyl-CoA:carnitine CoA-transferase CaiB-like acyl-CoA transferase